MCEPTSIAALGSLLASPGMGALGVNALGGMTAFQTFGLATSIGSTLLTAKASSDQAAVNQRVAQNNATTAENNAVNAQRRGEEEALAIRRNAEGLKSSQRVGLAAHGLDLTYGTAADLQDQTDFFGQADAATSRTNAGRDAAGYRGQGANYRAEAKSQSPFLSGATSLLTGSAQVADKWYRYAG